MTYDYSEIVDYLLDWYDNNARILYWRENPKPYYVWISEIMLQQTRVEAVKLYFERFIRELPTIEDLAKVDDDKLMKLWEGLGYYNRARNLKKAACMIMEEYNGRMPSEYSQLLELPGIGSYTAGAIASIAFGKAEPAVDGNVLRVMKRLCGSFDDITKASVKKQLEQDLREIIPKKRPGDFNQAVMDIGALVCIPNGRPLCDKCPFIHLCKAFHNHTELMIPVKPEKKARKIEEKTIFLVEREKEYLIRKRENKGLLAGLWELPNRVGNVTLEGAENLLRELGMEVKDIEGLRIESMGEAKHIFSHVEWHMKGYYIQLPHEERVFEDAAYSFIPEEYKWASKEEINQVYSIPSAFEFYIKRIKE